MPTIADFIPASGYKFPSRQILPSQSRSNEPLAVPQIHTAWQFALAKYRPFTLETEESVLAHRNLLRHLISDQAPSSPQQGDPSTPNKPYVTIPELKSPTHAPYVLFLFLNIGLIRAWLGETFRAKRYFETASPMDDGKVPANRAILLYLLGCTQFLLKQWRPSRRSFERCLLSFRKSSGARPDKGELELGLAAPWVGVSLKEDPEAQRRKERERALESTFKYKVYVPPLPNGEGVTPKHERDTGGEEAEWQEWSLERTAVEANLAAAKMKLAWKESGRESEADEDIEINGFPGGVLFYPLGLASTTKTPTPDPKPQTRPPPLERSKQNPPPNTPLPTHRPPTWNEETQSFDPYLPSPLTTSPAPPTPQSHPPPPPTSHPPPAPQPLWQNIDSEPSPTLAAQIEEDTRRLHFDPPPLSTYDLPMPPPSRASTTSPEHDPHAPFPTSERTSERTPNRETNRQRLERVAEGRNWRQTVGRRDSLEHEQEGRERGTGRSVGGRLKGMVRRSVASLRRGSARGVGPVSGFVADGSAIDDGSAVLDEDEEDTEELCEEGEEEEKEEEAEKVSEHCVIGTEVRDFKFVYRGTGNGDGDDGDGLGMGGILRPLAYLP